jgi:NADPH:quinone reductase-like Zn-dependent oxidoreductase
MSTSLIQAIRVHHYGGPEQLKLEQIARPEPQAGEVLVRVYAAGIASADWKTRQGLLKDLRPMQLPYIPGSALAGIVEEVGSGVTAFQRGQAVFGQSAKGTYTEYTTASVGTLALKPKTLSFDEAATLAGSATTAWQGLFEYGSLQTGQAVLIRGAAGGVGSFAVQFARWMGAHVIGTTSPGNADFVRSLGAETVIDYTSTPLEQVVHDMDLVFDTVGGETDERPWNVLKRGGTLVSITGPVSQEKAQELGVRAVSFSNLPSTQLLQSLARLIEEEHITVALRRTFPLHEVRQAHELSQTGHGRGRIVLHIADEPYEG